MLVKYVKAQIEESVLHKSAFILQLRIFFFFFRVSSPSSHIIPFLPMFENVFFLARRQNKIVKLSFNHSSENLVMWMGNTRDMCPNELNGVRRWVFYMDVVLSVAFLLATPLNMSANRFEWGPHLFCLGLLGRLLVLHKFGPDSSLNLAQQRVVVIKCGLEKTLCDCIQL